MVSVCSDFLAVLGIRWGPNPQSLLHVEAFLGGKLPYTFIQLCTFITDQTCTPVHFNLKFIHFVCDTVTEQLFGTNSRFLFLYLCSEEGRSGISVHLLILLGL